jgi:hypothetical protein
VNRRFWLDVSGEFALSVSLRPSLGRCQPLHLLRMRELTAIRGKPTLAVRRRTNASGGGTHSNNQDEEVHQATHRPYLERNVARLLMLQFKHQSKLHP